MMNKLLRFLILNIKDRKIISIFNDLNKSQYNDRNIILDKQLYKLQLLLKHAYNNVPYYKALLDDTGLVNEGRIELKSINQLRALPLLTKDIIREQKDNMYSLDINERKAYRNTSGGSTGEPVVFMQDMKYMVNNLASTYLARSWRGAGLYDSTVVLWGAERDTFEGKKPFTQVVKDFLLNTLRLNTFVLSGDVIECYIKILNKRKPRLIISYVQSIYTMAQYAREKGIKVKKQQAIHAAAGTVFPFMREEIEKVFGCKVFNHYGSRETGPIASECSNHKGLHIMMEHTLVEVLDKNGKPCISGEEGEIVITTLNNYSMPLIRYKIGDIGVIDKENNCDCSCNYSKLASIKGRVTGIFKTANGGVVDGESFTHLFYFIEEIKIFQIIRAVQVLLYILPKTRPHHYGGSPDEHKCECYHCHRNPIVASPQAKARVGRDNHDPGFRINILKCRGLQYGKRFAAPFRVIPDGRKIQQLIRQPKKIGAAQNP